MKLKINYWYALAGVVLFAMWRTYSQTGRGTSAIDALQVQANLAGAMVSGTGASGMRLSESGLHAIAVRERFSAVRYRDAKGHSIGYGHFIKLGESFSEPMTEQYAHDLLRADAGAAANAVRAYVKATVTQNQFDALVSLVYNIGAGAFKESTVLRKLNAGDYLGAASGFDLFNKSEGVVNKTLIARRAEEKSRFLTA